MPDTPGTRPLPQHPFLVDKYKDTITNAQIQCRLLIERYGSYLLKNCFINAGTKLPAELPIVGLPTAYTVYSCQTSIASLIFVPPATFLILILYKRNNNPGLSLMVRGMLGQTPSLKRLTHLPVGNAWVAPSYNPPQSAGDHRAGRMSSDALATSYWN